ncbi:MAG: rRNA maturation RNase YbeY [Pigeon pea little leaf phytoplasma]|uniref:Endoribonuclease YbeY n=1 Tax=Candidatus Phytoplasma fabacearum TaxID=2982628 RepID=A0ABU8ZTA2_9MOLU|nr:rRNA maturation RNase YbeY ['Bituminaria bituminosa' little leaf phytoplasma]MDV3148667.1 rRNA maturation RNase YbeY [Pigeon pea little leaf phytoplasma]MDO7983708.1 rRNA maturation RNase YbeY ['Bituminaria bituminosa' little leaf phytoplasma]MDO8023996.1 rRNA maturation RNase YbeY ['Bituminaria bituminosa' little leaf phytoplasma]MDO8030713.1 rRNA maturation RNase YbeY ['Bituminaria bituminosa' little leaf phytoplasma]MDV3153970.1 rRNA maturation RNase YbeY [Pigeon pea little leaf phytopla
MDVKIVNNTNFEVNYLSIVLIKIFQDLDIGKKINIIFVNDEYMKKVNYFYLKKNYTTDVLAFNDYTEDISLGDILISLPKAFEQAIQNNITDIQEVSFLVLHGYLHLKGYDDKTEESLCEMIDLQQKILKKHNLDFNY